MTGQNDETATHQGRCLCGAVRFSFDGKPNWTGWCHCDSCRRNTSSPATAFIGVPSDRFRHTGDAPRVYESSPGVRRSFCGKCGSPVSYEADQFPDEVHLYAAAMENPGEWAPRGHVFADEQLVWCEILDDLPRFRGSGGGNTPDWHGPKES